MINNDKTELHVLKLEKLRRLELEVRREIWRKNPILWLKDRLGVSYKTFIWSLYEEEYKLHIWDGTKNPLSTALEAIANRQWVGIESGTGVGKTYMAAHAILFFLDVYIGSTVVFLANSERQLKMNLWKEIGKIYHKFKKLHPKSELLSLNLRMDNSVEKASNSFGYEAIGLTAGVGVNEESATKLQGIHNQNLMFVIEEMAGANPAVTQAIFQTCVSDNNVILGLGNPDAESDELHKFCKLKRVTHIRASALDFPNVVLNRDVVKGAVTRSSIAHRLEELGADSDLYQSRVRGISPAQSKDSLIKIDWFNQCINHKPEVVSYNAVGCDVAKSENGDKGAVAWGQGSILIGIKDFQCSGVTGASDIAYNLIYNSSDLLMFGGNDYDLPTLYELGIDASGVGIDAVGIGVSVIEAFYRLGYTTVGLSGGQWEEALLIDETSQKALFRFVSLRAQMYYQAREDLRKMEVGIDIKDTQILERLRKELCSPKLVPSPSGIKVEEKAEIVKRLGSSPNLADAFVYWNWMRHGYRRVSSLYLPLGA